MTKQRKPNKLSKAEERERKKKQGLVRVEVWTYPEFKPAITGLSEILNNSKGKVKIV